MSCPPELDAQRLAEAAPTPMAVVDEAGRVRWANPAWERAAESQGCVSQTLADRLADDPPSVTPLTSPAGWRLLATAPGGQSVADPGERDALTGVLTRGALDRECGARWRAAEAAPFALAFLDLDDFKRVNDASGHAAGDACLREVGARLLGAVREADAVGRDGGDEFVLLLAGVTTESDAAAVVARLRDAVAKPIGPEGQVSAPLSASVGVAFSHEHTSLADLVRAADRAMYEQKGQAPR